MSGSDSRWTINQQNQIVDGPQIFTDTFRGNVTYNPHGKSDAVEAEIKALQARVAGLSALPAALRQQVDEALASTAKLTPSPEHAQVKARLDGAGSALAQAAERLEGADDVASKALALAQTLFKIGKWVVAAAIF